MSKRVLYFDCFSGISGDMTVAALLDAGVESAYLTEQLARLNLEGYELEICDTQKKGITGKRFNVKLLEEKHSHSHHDDHHHEHHSRNLKDIESIIDKSGLNENITKISKKIFAVVAEAESKVHGKSIDEIHFHEVGAVDSIIDIVGAAICIDRLGVDEIVSSSVNLGGGFVKCAHGLLPVPAPAVVEILKGVPVYSSGIQKELTTPTGAAILKALCSSFADFPNMVIEKTGYGLGMRDLEIPNALRVVIGTDEKSSSLIMLETNIDNMSGEIYSYLFPKLFSAKALDVFATPVIMKKNRPAQVLSVLCSAENVSAIEHVIFTETTTLGIRKYRVERDELVREKGIVSTVYGDVHVKKSYLDGNILRITPEYEDCARIASERGIPLVKVMNDIQKELGASL